MNLMDLLKEGTSTTTARIPREEEGALVPTTSTAGSSTVLHPGNLPPPLVLQLNSITFEQQGNREGAATRTTDLYDVLSFVLDDLVPAAEDEFPPSIPCNDRFVSQ